MTNYQNNRLPQLIVLHATAFDEEQSLKILSGETDREVSAHYLISQSGDINQIVAEDKRAWHAGKSVWRGIKDINSISLGIELVCPVDFEEGQEANFDSAEFPDQQVSGLITLLEEIFDRYPELDRRHIVSHQQIAPGRKFDPGPNFPWGKLSEHEIGIWPKQEYTNNGEPISDVVQSAFFLYLEQIGFNIDAPISDVLKAFRDRFGLDKSGELDQHDIIIAKDLVAQILPVS